MIKLFNKLSKKSGGFLLSMMFLVAIIISVTMTYIYIRSVNSPEEIRIYGIDDDIRCLVTDDELNCNKDYARLNKVSVSIRYINTTLMTSIDNYDLDNVEINLTNDYKLEEGKIILTKDSVISNGIDMPYKDFFIKTLKHTTTINNKLPIIDANTINEFSSESTFTTTSKIFIKYFVLFIFSSFINVIVMNFVRTFFNYMIIKIRYKRSYNYQYLLKVTFYAALPIVFIDLIIKLFLLESLSGFLKEAYNVPTLLVGIISMAIIFFISKLIINYKGSFKHTDYDLYL